MAIKPLKSIKFPGLPDTYTVPQVDSVPTQGSNNAVSSGGVYEQLAKKLSISAYDATTLSDNTDLDTLVTVGTYRVSSSSHASTMINAPVTNVAYVLIVMDTNAATRKVQIAVTGDLKGSVYIRSKTNDSAWNSWGRFLFEGDINISEIIDSIGDITNTIDTLTTETINGNYLNASVIPDNTDFDSITTVGNYRVTSRAHASTMINCAPVLNAFRMVVMQLTASDRLVQIIIEQIAEARIFVRIKATAGLWSKWRTLAYGSEYYYNPENLPNYYFNYLPNRVNAIVGNYANMGDNSDSLIFFSDPHYYRDTVDTVFNGLHSTSIIKYLIDRTNINHVVCGGDLTSGTTMTTDAQMALLKQVKVDLSPIWDKTYMIIGNHEWNNPANTAAQRENMLTMNQMYPLLLKDKERQYGALHAESGSYWIDNPIQKIRYFYLSCNSAGNINRSELLWFKDQCAVIPDGYAIVVLSHIGLLNDLSWCGRFSVIVDILDAVKGKTTFEYLYPGTSIPMTADYSNLNVTVVGVISGHIHMDLYRYTDGGIPVIAVTCDQGITNTSTDDFKSARAYGTTNEQAIEVVQIDVTNRKIYTFRVGGTYDGAGSLENPDREFTF